jgi:hypothetical protein
LRGRSGPTDAGTPGPPPSGTPSTSPHPVDDRATDEETLAEAPKRRGVRDVFCELPERYRFAFADHAGRDQIYRYRMPSRLRVVRRKIGESMERRLAPPPAELIPELAHPSLLGRDSEKSSGCNLEPADRSEEPGPESIVTPRGWGARSREP